MKIHFWKKTVSRLRTKILLFGLFMSIVPFVFMGLVNMEISRGKLVEQVHSANQATMQNSVDQLENLISQTFQSMFVLRDSMAVGPTSDENLYYLFHSFMKNVPYVESISRFSSTGNELYTISRWNIHQKGEQNRQLLEQIRQGKTYISPVLPNADGKMIVTLAVPDHLPSEPNGGILVQINLKQLFDQLSTHTRVSKDTTIALLDEKGKLIGASKSIRMDDGTKGNFRYTMRVPSTQWTVVLEQAEQSALASFQQIKMNLILSTLLIVLLVSAISVVFALFFSGPIEKIDSGVRAIAEGNFFSRIRVSGSDEIGRLAESVNAMAERLQQKTNELLEEKQRLDMVVSGMGMGLIVVDEDFRVGWVNRTVKDWFQTEQLVGKHCREAFGEQCDLCETCPVHTEAMVSGNQREMISTRVDQQGRLRYFRHQVFRLHPEKRKSPFLEVIEDITEKREMEAAVIQADKLAAIGMLASGIAHEINNPLGILSVYGEDLKERLDEEDLLSLADSGEIEKYLDTIQKQIIRCKEITSHLLHFSRKSSTVHEPVNIHSCLEETLELIRHEVRKKQIQVIKNYEATDAFVNATTSEMQQVFLNLFTNALDAMEGQGILQVHTSNPDNTEVVMEIVDNGKGIHPDHLLKIFDPFFTTKPAGKGTGLGLSVCYGIVKKFGGDLHITSQSGMSTTVTIRLPVRKERH
ncbi:ATP-binding protein [Brevibacillus sp. SYSU BS000544]|uniref:ATP-binding protein n=1 Tax=Brevibacillus sp. SYSU BS000544 TaxID=3416443 RepID=UPI003CE4EBA9